MKSFREFKEAKDDLQAGSFKLGRPARKTIAAGPEAHSFVTNLVKYKFANDQADAINKIYRAFQGEEELIAVLKDAANHPESPYQKNAQKLHQTLNDLISKRNALEIDEEILNALVRIRVNPIELVTLWKDAFVDGRVEAFEDLLDSINTALIENPYGEQFRRSIFNRIAQETKEQKRPDLYAAIKSRFAQSGKIELSVRELDALGKLLVSLNDPSQADLVVKKWLSQHPRLINALKGHLDAGQFDPFEAIEALGDIALNKSKVSRRDVLSLAAAAGGGFAAAAGLAFLGNAKHSNDLKQTYEKTMQDMQTRMTKQQPVAIRPKNIPSIAVAHFAIQQDQAAVVVTLTPIPSDKNQQRLVMRELAGPLAEMLKQIGIVVDWRKAQGKESATSSQVQVIFPEPNFTDQFQGLHLLKQFDSSNIGEAKEWKFGNGIKGTVRAAITKHPDKFDSECKDKDRLCPYAVFSAMKKKGFTPHYKDQKSTVKGKPQKKFEEFRVWLEEEDISVGETNLEGYILTKGFSASGRKQEIDPEDALSGGAPEVYKFHLQRRKGEPRIPQRIMDTRMGTTKYVREKYETLEQAIDAFQKQIYEIYRSPDGNAITHISLAYHRGNIGAKEDIAFWNRPQYGMGNVVFAKNYQHLANQLHVPSEHVPATKTAYQNWLDKLNKAATDKTEIR